MAALKIVVCCSFAMICLDRNSSNVRCSEIFVSQTSYLSFYSILENSDITSLNIAFIYFLKIILSWYLCKTYFGSSHSILHASYLFFHIFYFFISAAFCVISSDLSPIYQLSSALSNHCSTPH